MRFPRPNRLVPALLLAFLAACGGGDTDGEITEDAWKALGITKDRAEFEDRIAGLDDVPIDPKPVVGKNYEPVFPDPIPFEPGEWETESPEASPAVPDAPKGGEIRLTWISWPPTLRTEGPNSRLSTLSDLHSLVYESLLSYDVSEGRFTPNLATHWWISEDKLTYRFRIDPRARWADGREVTADDVVATIEHLQNPDRRAPTSRQWKELVESATMLDKYTVEIKTGEPLWRTMVMVGFQDIYPAAYIRMDGQTYLEEWNWKLPPGTGPYEVRPENIHEGESITLHRRDDWWQKELPRARGTYNFDEITWTVVRDRELIYLKFLAGELDVYFVGRAQRWVEELDGETPIAKGWVQKRKIYNLNPEGYGGFCFNMREEPFDDVRVRKAFAHLFNREKLFAKIFFYQYEYVDSYYPGQPWARPDAERIRYDPDEARRLLAEAGWVRRDDEGWLVNEDGERFPELTLEFSLKSWTRIHSVTKNELWQEAGIRMNLNVVDSASLLKKIWEYRFRVTWFSWTAGIFPNPEFQFHSKYADVPQSNNLNGFKNDEADAIMDAYKSEFDAAERVKMLQRLDEILFEAHPYALNWFAPYFRVLYWDKFGHPPEYASRYGRDVNNLLAYWWYDEAKWRRTQANMGRNEGNYPDRPLNQVDDVKQTWWLTNPLPMSDGESEDSSGKEAR